MLLLDRVIEVSEDGIIAELDIRDDQFFFQGHFPNNPIMPGVLIVEAIAQAGALLGALLAEYDTKSHLFAFTGVENAKFRRQVKPNETLCVRAEIVKKRRSLYKFNGTAHVNNQLVASVSFSASLIETA